MPEVPEVSSLRRLSFEDAAEAGLTLIELLVVLLIISILLAIVIPTFTKRTETAQSTLPGQLALHDQQPVPLRNLR